MSERPTQEQLASLWIRTVIIQPAPGQVVLACGRTRQRFMWVDKLGQWHDMMKAPRQTPAYWMPMLPNPVALAEKKPEPGGQPSKREDGKR